MKNGLAHVTFDFRNHKHVVNSALNDLRNNISQLSHIPAFNSELNGLDVTTCTSALVKHRIVSKFCMPDNTKKNLRAEAFESYLQYENVLKERADSFTLWDPTRVGYVMRCVKSKLSRWFGNFTITLHDADVRFSPGETFISSSGNVSILAKLSDIDHWTVTSEAAYDAAQLVYGNTSLKRLAKQHIGAVSQADRKKLFLEAKNNGYESNCGFYVFYILLMTRVFRIVGGARGATVPKNNEKARFINIEPMFNVILQMIVSQEIRRILRKKGNFLSPVGDLDAQELHGKLISRSCFSTIDFSNASDSILLKVVQSLFPGRFVQYLERYRSKWVTLDDVSIQPYKLSSMGNGFTFEVMSTLLYALASEFANNVRVYGDDVIIENRYAHEFIRCCEFIGFNVNGQKTFIESNFRESCGKFYHDDFGYIESYDIEFCKTFQDTIIVANKISRLCEQKYISNSLKCYLQDTHSTILSSFHASQRGPVPIEFNRMNNLSLYVWDKRWRQKQSKNKLCKHNYDYSIDKSTSYWSDLQLNAVDHGLVTIPFFVPLLSKRKRTRTAKFAATLYTGLRVRETIRGYGKWINLPAFVDEHGNVTLFRVVMKYQKRGILHVNDIRVVGEGRNFHPNRQ